MNNVRSYTDKELLDRVRSLPSFRAFPTNYWLIGVRSNEDAFNRFDDKFYLFKGEKFIDSWHGTTNAGSDLLHPSNPRGEAVLKDDGIYYDGWERRMHRGKVMAYCQRIPLPLYRDADRDTHIEETGTAHNEIVGINIHPSSYIVGSKIEREIIQGWSQGCQVFAIRADFDDFMDFTHGQTLLTYCLLKEFDPATTKPFTHLSDQEIDSAITAGSSAASGSAEADESAQPSPVPEPSSVTNRLQGSPTGSAEQPPPIDSPPIEQHAENIINAGGIGASLEKGLAKADDVGNRFQAFQGVLDKFGFADPDAARGKGTVVLVVLKFILAPILAVLGFLYNHPEYGVPAAVALIGLAVYLWNEAGKRKAHAKEGMPKELAEKIVEKK